CCVGGTVEDGAARVLVQDGEAWWHAGLDREPLQQALAKGMDGLHLKSAGRLDGDGEQLSGPLLVGQCRPPIEQLGKLALKARLVAHYPFREPFEHAL